MKKIIAIVTSITMVSLSSVFAGDVPEKFEQAFKRHFPGSSVLIWEKKDNISVAGFTENRIRYQAYFGADANLLGIAKHITIAQMPAKPLFAIKEKYGDFANVAAIEISFPDRETIYLTTVYFKNKIKTIKVYTDGSIEVLRSE